MAPSPSSELPQNTRVTISAAWWGAVGESGGQRKSGGRRKRKRGQRTSGYMKERQTHRYSQPSSLCYTARDRESMCSGVRRDLRSEAAATASFTSTMYEDGGTNAINRTSPQTFPTKTTLHLPTRSGKQCAAPDHVAPCPDIPAAAHFARVPTWSPTTFHPQTRPPQPTCRRSIALAVPTPPHAPGAAAAAPPMYSFCSVPASRDAATTCSAHEACIAAAPRSLRQPNHSAATRLQYSERLFIRDYYTPVSHHIQSSPVLLLHPSATQRRSSGHPLVKLHRYSALTFNAKYYAAPHPSGSPLHPFNSPDPFFGKDEYQTGDIPAQDSGANSAALVAFPRFNLTFPPFYALARRLPARSAARYIKTLSAAPGRATFPPFFIRLTQLPPRYPSYFYFWSVDGRSTSFMPLILGPTFILRREKPLPNVQAPLVANLTCVLGFPVWSRQSGTDALKIRMENRSVTSAFVFCCSTALASIPVCKTTSRASVWFTECTHTAFSYIFSWPL
ncbi:hypothetical protein B0H13DRAFT_1902677 [Mycena leptocephala]|nr:hypothetical protein B0H13DRAFT_1902677 [Mycena leptocephala]